MTWNNIPIKLLGGTEVQIGGEQVKKILSRRISKMMYQKNYNIERSIFQLFIRSSKVLNLSSIKLTQEKKLKTNEIYHERLRTFLHQLVDMGNKSNDLQVSE